MRWFLGHVFGGAIRFATATIIAAVCLMLGFVPSEWVATILGSPPAWVLNAWTRLGIVFIGVLIGSEPSLGARASEPATILFGYSTPSSLPLSGIGGQATTG